MNKGMEARSIIDNYTAELTVIRQNNETKPYSYYTSIRSEISEAIGALIEDKALYTQHELSKYIKRGNLTMEMAESMRKDMGNHSERMIRAASILLKDDYQELWKEIKDLAKKLKTY